MTTILDSSQLVKLKELATAYYAHRITRDKIETEMGYSRPTIERLLKLHGLWQRKTEHTKHYPFDETFFDTIDTEEKAYHLGFIMADGCVYIGKKNDHLLRVHIHRDDDKVILDLIRVLKLPKPPTYSGRYVEIKVFSKRIVNSLIRLGCTPRKSLTLRFPTSDQVPDRLIHHFIRGYFDGDGTICRGKREAGRYDWIKTGFCSSHEFSPALKKHLDRWNVYSSIWSRGSIDEVVAEGFKNALIMRDRLYHEATIWLDRKRDRFDEVAAIHRKNHPKQYA